MLSSDNIPTWYAKQDYCQVQKKNEENTVLHHTASGCAGSIQDLLDNGNHFHVNSYSFLLSFRFLCAKSEHSEHAEAAKKFAFEVRGCQAFFVWGQAFIWTTNSLSCAAFCLYAWPNTLCSTKSMAAQAQILYSWQIAYKWARFTVFDS